MAQSWDVGDILQATICGVNEGTPFNVVMHFRIKQADTDGVLCDDLRQFIETNILPNIAAEQTDKCIWQAIYFSRVAPTVRNVEYITFTTPIPGTVTTDGLPNGVACVIRAASDDVGPSARGRVYMCGIPEASSNGGLLVAARRAAIESAWQAFLGDIAMGSGNTVTWCVFSRTQWGPAGGAHPVVTPYWHIITSVSVQGNLGSQRRRRFPTNATG